MAKNKPSFFERLTGTINVDEEDYEDIEVEQETSEEDRGGWDDEENDEEGQLAIDMYQTPELIVIQAMVAGVRPEDLDISISRELVTIKGRREGPRGIPPNDYYHRELYWGSFSRRVVLPQEIEVEEAEAVEDHGLLIVKLPKIDKERETRLKVKSQTNS